VAVRVIAAHFFGGHVKDYEIAFGDKRKLLVILAVGEAPARLSDEGETKKPNCGHFCSFSQPGFFRHLGQALFVFQAKTL
jgi:hypothetical protein